MDSQVLFSDDEIKEILDQDLLDLLGAKNMGEAQKQALYEKMAHTVEDRAVARIDDALDDPGREEFIKLIDEGDKTKVEEFLRSKDIDVAKIMVEEAIIYKMEIVNLAKAGKAQKQE